MRRSYCENRKKPHTKFLRLTTRNLIHVHGRGINVLWYAIKLIIKVSTRETEKMGTPTAHDASYGPWILLTRRYPGHRRHAVRRQRTSRVCKAPCRQKHDDDSRLECCSIPLRLSPSSHYLFKGDSFSSVLFLSLSLFLFL